MTGAERYLARRLEDPEYRQAYEEARTYEPSNPHALRTVTNRIVDPWALTSDDIDIFDIATALSHTNRFLGQTATPMSVATHSIWVARHVWRHTRDLNLELAGLLHDASEAYLGDVPSPLKRRPEYAAYREAEWRAQQVIADWAQLPPEYLEYPEVHAADKASYEIEREVRFDPAHRSFPPHVMRDQFIAYFNRLQQSRGFA